MSYHEGSSAQDINYRKSGFILAGGTAVIYFILLIRGKHQPYVLITGVVIAVLAWFEALPLRKAVDLLNQIGNFMHRFTNPFVFGLIYVVAIIPTAIVLKILGKDVLNLRYDCNRSSYWEARPSVDSWNDSFHNQF